MYLSAAPSNSNRFNIKTFCLGLVGVFAFTFSTIIPSYAAYFSIAICFFVAVLTLFNRSLIDKNLTIFFLAFCAPFIVSILSLPLSMVNEMHRFDYSQLNIWGRISNILMFTFLMLIAFSFSNSKTILYLFKWYKLGILVLLLTAIWHAVSLYTGLISWPFETRSNLHSAYGNEYSFSNRVTGIAREPSFFVMYVVDFVALSFVFYKGFYKVAFIFLACFLMLLSLSPSGYIVLFMSITLSYFFCRCESFSIVGFAKFLFSVCIVILIGVFLVNSENPFFEYITNRIVNADSSNSGRLFMLLGPFDWVKESGLFSLVFGHGVKSYAIIGSHYLLPSGEPVHVTSNNLYVDVFWEGGVLGLFLLLSFFTHIFIRICFLKFSSYQKFIAFFVFFDLVFSSLFRADYASLRFFIMLYLLYILLRFDVGFVGRVRSTRVV